MRSRPNVVVFGQPGSYSDAVAERYFGGRALFSYDDWIPDIFGRLKREKAKYAVLPAYNFKDGEIEQTWQGLYADSGNKIVAEMYETIEHCLLASPRTRTIKKVASIPTALRQCERWRRKRGFTGAKLIETKSTAAAAELAAKTPGVGAIASEHAAQLYGLKVIRRDIADVENNRTRFFVVEKRGTTWPTGHDKTSMAVETREDRPGLLYEILGELDTRKINMTMLFSRPVPGHEEAYRFFIDFEGHAKEPKIRRMLKAIRSEHRIKVLGSYQRANVKHS